MDGERRVPWSAARVAREAGLLVVVALVQLGPTTAAAPHREGSTPLVPWGYALIWAGVLLLPFRHRWPAATLVAVWTVTLAYWTADFPPGPVFLALIVALGAVVIRGLRRVALGVMAAGYLLFPWLGWVIGTREAPGWPFLLGLAAWLVAIASLLEVVRYRHDRARDAERARVEEARARAQEERLRIAREVHDAVAHSMSLITIQAGVALHLGDDLPPQAREALTVIRTASRESLAELRGILGVLRDVDGSAPLAPTPGLGRLAELRRWAGQVGLDAGFEVGDLPDLPRNVDVAAYRIVQESLTNVVRHAGPCRAAVTIAAAGGVLEITVLDDGAGRLGPDPEEPGARDVGTRGNGIAGMRERATALGGTLEAGPRPGGGFAVRARLPLPGPDEEPATATAEGVQA